MQKQLNIANMLSIFRILIVPLIVVLLYEESSSRSLLAFFFLLVAFFTDMLDGYIARKYGEITNLGKFLDPLADKLLISTTLIMFVHLSWVPTWIVVVIICREMLVTGLRAVASEQGIVIAADKWGKLKTILQSVALLFLVYHYPIFGISPIEIGMVLLYLALILTVFSGVNYLYSYSKSFR